MNGVSKKRVRTTPLNSNSTNVYTASSFPTISFLVGSQRAFIDPKTIKLNGNYSILRSDNNLPTNTPGINAGGAGNGTGVNNQIGAVMSCLDEINISTLNGRSLESIRQFASYVASATQLTHTQLEYDNGMGLSDPTLNNKSVSSARVVNTSFDFSIPLPTGMFESQKYINISEKGLNGFQIDILLARDAQALGPYFNYSGVKSSVLDTSVSVSYKLSNLFLTYDLIIPSEKVFNSLPSSGSMSYQTINTLNSTLTASDATINLRLGGGAITSLTHTIIPTQNLNNITQDSYELLNPQNAGGEAPVKEVQYLKGGVNTPFTFILDSEEQLDLPSKVAVAPQSEILKTAQNGISLYENTHNKLSPNANLGLLTALTNSSTQAQIRTSAPDPNTIPLVLGYATSITEQGVSFKNQEYSIRIQSELANDNVNAFRTFSRNRNILSFSPTGINVIE